MKKQEFIPMKLQLSSCLMVFSTSITVGNRIRTCSICSGSLISSTVSERRSTFSQSKNSNMKPLILGNKKVLSTISKILQIKCSSHNKSMKFWNNFYWKTSMLDTRPCLNYWNSLKILKQRNCTKCLLTLFLMELNKLL